MFLLALKFDDSVTLTLVLCQNLICTAGLNDPISDCTWTPIHLAFEKNAFVTGFGATLISLMANHCHQRSRAAA